MQHSRSPHRGELRADTRNVAATNRDIASQKHVGESRSNMVMPKLYLEIAIEGVC
jgi:hypothetical protein